MASTQGPTHHSLCSLGETIVELCLFVLNLNWQVKPEVFNKGEKSSYKIWVTIIKLVAWLALGHLKLFELFLYFFSLHEFSKLFPLHGLCGRIKIKGAKPLTDVGYVGLVDCD